MSKSLSLFFSLSVYHSHSTLFSPLPSSLKLPSCFSLSHSFYANLLNSPVCICSAGPPLLPSHALSSSRIVNMERQRSVVFNIYSASVEDTTNRYINIRLLFKKKTNRLCQFSVVDGSFWWYFVNVKPLTCAFSLVTAPPDWKTENNKALQNQQQTGMIFVCAHNNKKNLLLLQKQLQFQCIDISPRGL